MILDKSGEKVTPTKRAHEIVSDTLNNTFDYLNQENMFRDDSMTDREWKLTQEAIGKLMDKIDRAIG